MRRRIVTAMSWMLLVGAAGCGGGTGRVLSKTTRPIVIVLSQKKNSNDCEASFGKRPQHAFKGDTIAWEFINNCGADQAVTLAVKSSSGNPFTTASPWNVTARQNNSSSPDEIALDVSASADPRVYGFDIQIGGRTYDPKLEIDP